MQTSPESKLKGIALESKGCVFFTMALMLTLKSGEGEEGQPFQCVPGKLLLFFVVFFSNLLRIKCGIQQHLECQ